MDTFCVHKKQERAYEIAAKSSSLRICVVKIIVHYSLLFVPTLALFLHYFNVLFLVNR